MNDYQAKREARIERLRAAAAKRSQEASAAYKQSTDMMSVIPMGQPIMIGHHSEKRDRAYRERAWNKMGKSVALSNEVAELERRAEAAESNSAISSDDPEAVVLMREKIAGLEAVHAEWKESNAKLRKAKISLEDPNYVEKLKALNLPIAVAKELAVLAQVSAYVFRPYIKLPSYILSNSNANITRCKDRLKVLEAMAAERKAAEESNAAPAVKTIGSVRIEEHPEENRIWLVFPGKPSREVIDKVKAAGFRWAPSDKAWKRHLNGNGQYAAEHVAKVIETINGAKHA